MSFLKSALDLASLGFHVFPLQVGGKLPIIDDFPNRATKDPEQIKAWWTDPIMGIEQPYNIGISTTQYNCSQALVVVDVDNKGAKKGSDELFKLEMQGLEFAKTFSQKTPTGGEHIIYKALSPVKQGVSVLGKGLDIRSKGGYIVGSGSVIDDVPYTHTAHGLVDCPEWIIKACEKVPEKSKLKISAAKINSDTALLRGQHYLEKEAPHSVEGDGGDQTAFKVASHLKDFGLNPDMTLDLMLDYWNDQCQPPWNPEDLKTKVENAFRYGHQEPGVKAPEKSFKPINPGDLEESDRFYLQKMNDKYALLFGDGNHTIIHETVNEKGHPRRTFMSEVSFKRKFSPKTIIQGRGKPLTWADVWLDWEGRREYSGICFKPEQTPRHGYYNLWRGFTCKPKPYAEAGAMAKVGFDMFYEHLRDNIAGGDDELFNWIMGYFAHMIQKPYERPLTTLVLKGTKGVGKNAPIDRVGKLLGTGHYLVAHNKRYLTSNFNGHLDSALCLVLDEAFWSGDVSAEGILKGLTTSSEILIERKGREPYVIDNLVRLVILGNEDWLVPASEDERRYAVFKVGENRKQDKKFFHDMRVAIDEKGGNQVLLHYLQNFDLKTVDVNTAPATDELLEQKIATFGLFEEFWFQCLVEGKIIHADFESEWQENLSKNRLRDAFITFCRKKNVKSRMPSARAIGKRLMQMCPPARKRAKTKEDGEWVSSYVMPDLKTCREYMSQFLRQEVKWALIGD